MLLQSFVPSATDVKTTTGESWANCSSPDNSSECSTTTSLDCCWALDKSSCCCCCWISSSSSSGPEASPVPFQREISNTLDNQKSKPSTGNKTITSQHLVPRENMPIKLIGNQTDEGEDSSGWCISIAFVVDVVFFLASMACNGSAQVTSGKSIRNRSLSISHAPTRLHSQTFANGPFFFPQTTRPGIISNRSCRLTGPSMQSLVEFGREGA